MFARIQRIHFVGIGGIGMSGIAEVLLNLGYKVSGSDLKRSSVTEHLKSLGATIFEGHSAENIACADVVVASSAVTAANAEVAEATRSHIPVIQRAEMLAELMRLKYGIAIAGMHGKTTTTSMVAAVLAAGGLDPTVVVGGRVDAMGSNARLGRSQYLVAEADESDRSFLKLSPILAVVTNIDREHMDCYRNMQDVKRTFVEFMDRLPFYGMVVVCNDDPILRKLVPKIRRRMTSYGTRKGSDFLISIEKNSASSRLQSGDNAYAPLNIRNNGSGLRERNYQIGGGLVQNHSEQEFNERDHQEREGDDFRHTEPGLKRKGVSAPVATLPIPVNRFRVTYRGKDLGEFRLRVPGLHNVLNATAAIAVGIGLDIPVEHIQEALEGFRGVDRRFQLRGEASGIAVVDDYGHHPTEIKATLAAARQCGYRKIHVIFQPHRYTRTRDLMDEFTTAFNDADSLFVLDIYPASEQPIEGITGETLARRIAEKCGGQVSYVSSFEEAVSAAASVAEASDMILTLGAGSVSQLGPMLLEKLQKVAMPR